MLRSLKFLVANSSAIVIVADFSKAWKVSDSCLEPDKLLLAVLFANHHHTCLSDELAKGVRAVRFLGDTANTLSGRTMINWSWIRGQ